ncbi:MAG: hypothetical protein K2W94_08690 [Alphaproteobacteria bacterium]|nr:hypothetical protein [Alphaproteobacteria bacterium]
MTTLPELYKNLEKYSKVADESDVEKYLDTLNEILLKKDSTSLKEILKHCKEDYEYDIINESLPDIILYFLDEEGIRSFLPYIGEFFEHCPSLCEEIVSILFNSKEDYEIFRKHIHRADKLFLLRLFDLMEKESPHHKELITQLRKELENSKAPK